MIKIKNKEQKEFKKAWVLTDKNQTIGLINNFWDKKPHLNLKLVKSIKQLFRISKDKML